jgi:hypothetical protein
MLTHKDPEVQVMLGLLENQRDYVYGNQQLHLAKRKCRIKSPHYLKLLEAAEPENQDGNAI